MLGRFSSDTVDHLVAAASQHWLFLRCKVPAEVMGNVIPLVYT